MNTVTLDVNYLSPSTLVAIIQDLMEGGYGIRLYDTCLISQLEALVGIEEARRMLDEKNPFIIKETN